MGILSYLVAHFRQIPVAQRPEHLLLLPTKNLLEQFQFRLTKACGTTLLPYCYTLATFIQDYGQIYISPLPGAGRLALLHQITAGKSFAHFAPGSEKALLSLWDDFVLAGHIGSAEEMLSGSFLSRIRKKLAPTLTRSATYQSYMADYLEEFNEIFCHYLTLLAAKNLHDPQLISRRQIQRTISQLPMITSRLQCSVADLYDAPPVQMDLLRHLAKAGARFLFSGYRFTDRGMLPQLMSHLKSEQIIWCSPPAKRLLQRAASPQQPSSKEPPTDPIVGRVFPSIAAECSYVIHRALALVSSGMPPEEITIVIADQHHYKEIFYSLLHALPTDRLPMEIFSFNLKRQISATAMTIFIEALLRLAGGAPLSTQLLLEVIESPYFALFFPNRESGGETIETGKKLLRQELADQTITTINDLDILGKREKDPQLQQGITALKAAQSVFPPRASLAHYVKTITDLIDQSTGLLSNLYENAGREQLATIAADLQQLGIETIHTPASFHAFFRTIMAEEETGLDYDYLSGIQVLDPRDAKGIATQALFLIGNSSRSFLGRHRHRCRFTGRQQDMLSFVSPAQEEILQRFTVFSLANNCRQTWLTRALEIDGRIKEASIFVKELTWAGMETLMPDVELVWRTGRSERSAGKTKITADSTNLIPIKQLPKRLSGHQATSLFQCPARYLFDGLKLNAPTLRDQRLDPLGEGAILHRITEELGKCSPQPATKAAILARIRDISQAMEITWEERMLFSFLEKSGAWDRLADFLLASGSCLAVEEWVAADLSVLAGQPLQGVGKIDRRDHGPGGVRLVDYKRNQIPSAKAVTSFADVQLLFYALLKSLQGETIDRVAYYSIRKRRANCTEVEAAPLLSAFSTILKQQLDGIPAAGGYRKNISRTCVRCPYQEICLDETQLRLFNEN
ncbi:MAG: PD-(D/E)XK nuclease family protein [Deltaproteobacteria bacterium]|nr:PD-(D/E)XK nuclease family protein [Candidatus Anaeroferrophillus wilburensis]MBN2889636.1 PD-(D/E)XK nuclease family protein [Deltaproteobacteria bacterium]